MPALIHEDPKSFEAARSSRFMRLRDRMREYRKWMLIVIAPTLIAAIYYYLIAANQYQSESHFVIRSADSADSAPSGLNQALTMVGGVASSERDAMIVADFLTSHDATAQLQKRIGLIDRFRRPEADIASRLWSDTPTPELLARYYRRKVEVDISSETGITTLKVRSFRPSDSFAIIRELLRLSEERVNALNRRNYESAVAASRQQVAEAERDVDRVQQQITAFRRAERDFNPQVTGSARTGLVSDLQARLTEARAELAAMNAVLAANSPQVVAMRQRVAALAGQVAGERAQLASGPSNVASGLGVYEGIQLRQELAGKQFAAASAALQRAREDATRQQLFLVEVVAPNLPVKSLYPERTKIVLTIFFGLLLVYGIGWLVAAGVREHAA